MAIQFLMRNTLTPFRFIFCDDSTDDTLEYLKSVNHEKIILHSNKLRGIPKAINEGIDKVESRYYVIMANDVFVGYNWLSPLLEEAQKYDLGIISPYVFPNNVMVKHPPLDEETRFMYKKFMNLRSKYIKKSDDVNISTLNMILREVYGQFEPFTVKFVKKYSNLPLHPNFINPCISLIDGSTNIRYDENYGRFGYHDVDFWKQMNIIYRKKCGTTYKSYAHHFIYTTTRKDHVIYHNMHKKPEYGYDKNREYFLKKWKSYTSWKNV